MMPTDGATEYTTCEGLLTQSSSTWPKTSVFEIVASGVSANKLVIGKPATAADASNGFMDPATLGSCVKQAKAKGWNAGVMVWQVRLFPLFSPLHVSRAYLVRSQFPHADSAWIQAAKGGAF